MMGWDHRWMNTTRSRDTKERERGMDGRNWEWENGGMRPTSWDTLQKYLFFALILTKTLTVTNEKTVPPSPITVMFVVTQEMHTWAVRPKQHCTRGGEGGDFVSFRWKGCMARNWKIQFCWVAAPWLPCSCTWEGEGRDGWKDEWIGQMGGTLVPFPVKLISLRI